MKRLKRYIIHALVLIILHVFYFNSSWSLGGENELMNILNLVETKIIDNNQEYQNNFILINTAYNRQLATIQLKDGTLGSVAITNRKTLARTFSLLDSLGGEHRYVLCDIQFDVQSPMDSALESNLVALNASIFPDNTYGVETGGLNNVFSSINVAPAGYISYNGGVSKIELFNAKSSRNTLPLKMYEDLSGKQYVYDDYLTFGEGSLILKYIFPRYYIDNSDCEAKALSIGAFNDLLEFGGFEFYESSVKNKVIVIGNTIDDRHYTSLGFLPGPIVLYNTFLSIENGYHKVHWIWFAFAFVSFISLFYLSHFWDLIQKDRQKKGKVFLLFSELLTLSLAVAVISFFSSFIFSVHVTIIPVIVYVESAKLIRNYLNHDIL